MLNLGHPPHRPFRDSDVTEIGVDPDEVDPPDFLPDTPVVRKDWAEYLDAIERADRMVGRALDALRASGQEQRTIILFMGDHGPAFQRGKMSPYDLGLRVPLAISGPGIAKGIVSDALTSEVDLLPTILDLLGVELTALRHGRSLAPLLRGGHPDSRREYVFAEMVHPGPVRGRGMQERSVYDGRYHLIYREAEDQPRLVNLDIRQWKTWRNRSYVETMLRKEQFPRQYEWLRQIDPERLGGRPPRLELYDLKGDPDELTNLAEDPQHREALERLVKALGNWVRRTGDPYVDADRVWRLVSVP